MVRHRRQETSAVLHSKHVPCLEREINLQANFCLKRALTQAGVWKIRRLLPARFFVPRSIPTHRFPRLDSKKMIRCGIPPISGAAVHSQNLTISSMPGRGVRCTTNSKDEQAFTWKRFERRSTVRMTNSGRRRSSSSTARLGIPGEANLARAMEYVRLETEKNTQSGQQNGPR